MLSNGMGRFYCESIPCIFLLHMYDLSAGHVFSRLHFRLQLTGDHVAEVVHGKPCKNLLHHEVPLFLNENGAAKGHILIPGKKFLSPSILARLLFPLKELAWAILQVKGRSNLMTLPSVAIFSYVMDHFISEMTARSQQSGNPQFILGLLLQAVSNRFLIVRFSRHAFCIN